MRILVVCAAGASSTFVAQRVRRALLAVGLDHTVSVGTEATLPGDVVSADLVLVGPPLAASLDAVRRLAEPVGARVIPLPDDVHADLDGTRVLALVRSVAESDAAASA